MGRYDSLLEEPKQHTPPPPVKKEPEPVAEKPTSTPPPVAAKPQAIKKSVMVDSKKASMNASTLANKHGEVIEIIRKSVKQIGKEVTFVRLTSDEKTQLSEIVYTYKRLGIKTSENEIARIGLNHLIEDYKFNGEASVLARVIAALNA
jgi:hypothetical protein